MASHRDLKVFGFERFSHACAKRLLTLHPEWMPYVESVENTQGGLLVRTLSVNLPSENPNVPEPLTISTDLDKIITVEWFSRREGARWNVDWVFYMPFMRELIDWTNDDRGFDMVSEWVDKFTSEMMAAIWTDDGPGKGGSFGLVSAEDARLGTFGKPGEARTVVRSWRGSLDFEVK
jgi:hypothetical protein